MAWCDNPSSASVGNPAHHNMEHVTSSFQEGQVRVAIANSRSRPEKTMNHCILLVFPILFQREIPSHIFAMYYPKSIKLIAITNPVHLTALQPGTTRSSLPDRNPLRKVSFP